jgi:Fur family ferric uptake transcriptional regulator
LIDLRTGAVIEFRDEEIERLQQAMAERLGYRIVDHRLELFCVPIEEGGKKKGRS